MLRRRVPLIAASLLLLAGAIVATAWTRFPINLSLSVAQARAVERAPVGADQPSVPIEIQEAHGANEPLSTRSDIPSEVQTLVGRFSADVVKGPGWVHVMEKHQRNKDAGGELPNGQAIPTVYVTESWTQLDKDDQVEAVIALMKESGGKIVQVSTFQKGVWRNLTFDFSFEGGAQPPTADWGFGKELGLSASRGTAIDRIEGTANGRRILTTTIREQYVKPLKMAGFTKEVVANQRRLTIDAASGRPLSVETLVITVDGEERVSEHAEMITFERIAQPPTDITNLLVRSK